MKYLTLVLLASLLIACGGDSSAPTTEPAADTTPPPATETAPPPAPAELTISDAEVFVFPGGMAGGYLRVQGGATADHLESVTTSVAPMTETHETVDEEGVMKMQPRPDGFEVPAGGELLLEQGGKHLMFHGIEVADDVTEIEMTLHFTEAGEKTVTAAVRRPGDES